MKLIIAFWLGVVLFSPSTAQAENDPLKGLRGLKSGDMLRVVADSLGPVCGKFTKLSSDSLYLGQYPYDKERQPEHRLNYKPVNQLMEYRPLPVDLVVGLDDVSLVYRRGNGAGTGAIIGGILGGGSFFLGGVLLSEIDSGRDNSGAVVGMTVAGGLLGAGLGALIGSIFPKWKEVYKR